MSRAEGIAEYCAIALLCSLVIFQWLQTSAPIPRFFSVSDAFELVKACILVAAFSAALAFVLTRLYDAPRSIPVLHLLLLTSGLLAGRMASRLRETRREARIQNVTKSTQHVLVIGASRLAWFFSKMVEELAPGEYQIVAILDERPELQHRSLNGYPIVGSPEHIDKVVDAYAMHGIRIDKVILARQPEDLSKIVWDNISRVCRALDVELEILPERLISGPHVHADNSAIGTRAAEPAAVTQDGLKVLLGRLFWKIKRFIDVAAALTATITISPIVLAVSGLVLLDVGIPVVFWQQRVGRNGRPLYLYKFRTLQTLFDRRTEQRREAQNPSIIGQFLRKTRLDELPQLWNILSGEMSLIGPRPLLPVDQPKDSSLRLAVRPGITGWAQICGGKLISAEEKNALDEWYIRHASLRLDTIIVLRTIWMLLTGDRQDEKAISLALVEKFQGELANLSDSIKSEIKEGRSGFIKRAEVARSAEAAGFSSGGDLVAARPGDAPARSAYSKKRSV
jgi:lipopolysaccharide/colanic/teichoic acid biosynthesis glycosyltransferase